MSKTTFSRALTRNLGEFESKMYVRNWNGITRYELGKDSSGVFSIIRAHGSSVKGTAKKHPTGTKAVAIGVLIVLLFAFVLPFIGGLFGCTGTIFAVTCTGTFGSQAGALFVQAILVIVFVYVITWVWHKA